MTIAGLVTLTGLAWLHLLSGAGMEPMAGMENMAVSAGWPLLFAMWAAMMVAMMVPSAAPAILLYARVHRQSVGAREPPTLAFLGGYLSCWTAFSALAATFQIGIERAAQSSPITMALIGREAVAGVLIATGLYQLSPLKDACLGRCRSPAQFLTRHYRPGVWGAFRLGLIQGTFCIGCCWLLMALLFVGGVMNLLWIAGLTVLVAAEKLLPKGEWIARITGIAMIGWGATLLLA